jgi:branched-chain amino acid transport system substrate-binding protein
MRWLALAALAGLIPLSSGCGGATRAEANEAAGSQLAIYSSLPLQGSYAPISQQIVNGEKLALADARGRAGKFKIAFSSLDDANPATGHWDPGATSSNAKTAAQDTTTIAYIGDFNSGATAISLPLINGAGIMQVSPSSPYVGLTSSVEAGQDEPGRFYPTGHRTFARLVPGDLVEAAAQAKLMTQLGVHRLYVLDDQEAFQVPRANIVAHDAQAAGIVVAGHDSIATNPSSVYTGEIEKIVESHADAVFFAGGDGPGVVALWQALHAIAPGLVLLGSSSTNTEAFTSQLGSASATTYLTTPILARRFYPPDAQHVMDAYRRTFGVEASPYALYGYEAMSLVLASIRAAGAHGNDRQHVIERLFATNERRSVLGRYSIQPDGETTLSRYGVDRVVGGRAVFFRAIG